MNAQEDQAPTRLRLCAGVAMKGGDVLDADLVVDASGRLSRVQGWLTEGGYKTPRSVEVNPRIGYAGSVFSVPEEVRSISASCCSAVSLFFKYLRAWSASARLPDVAAVAQLATELHCRLHSILMIPLAMALILHTLMTCWPQHKLRHSTAHTITWQVVKQLGWKCLYVRPVAPDTRGVVCMLIEGGRMQVLTQLLPCEIPRAAGGHMRVSFAGGNSACVTPRNMRIMRLA